MLSKSIGYRQSMISGKGAASPSGTPPTYSVSYSTAVEHYTGSNLYNQINVVVDSSLGSGVVFWAECDGLANSYFKSNSNVASGTTDANGNVTINVILSPTSYNSNSSSFTLNVRTTDPVAGQIIDSKTGNVVTTAITVSSNVDTAIETITTVNDQTMYMYQASGNSIVSGDSVLTGTSGGEGNLWVDSYATFDYFIVGGGGRAGDLNAGGGGAGGIIQGNIIVDSTTARDLNVGSCGEFTNEGNSWVFGNTNIAYQGGNHSTTQSVRNGASGAGGFNDANVNYAPGVSIYSGQGNDGGSITPGSGGGAGGGGYSSVGEDEAEGAGGTGYVSDFTGSNVTYSTGGAGQASYTYNGGTVLGSLYNLPGTGGSAGRDLVASPPKVSFGAPGLVAVKLQGNVNHSVVLD